MRDLRQQQQLMSRALKRLDQLKLLDPQTRDLVVESIVGSCRQCHDSVRMFL